MPAVRTTIRARVEGEPGSQRRRNLQQGHIRAGGKRIFEDEETPNIILYIYIVLFVVLGRQ